MEIDINPTKKQTVSDDPELAKVLSGVNAAGKAAEEETENQEVELQYEEMENADAPKEEVPAAEEPAPSVPEPATSVVPAMEQLGINLDDIKSKALQDLRPLIDKLNVSHAERFDIILLLLRSSDDKTLIEPAYQSAHAIEDETKRANSLLEIIKEIDYLNSKNQPPTAEAA